MQKNGFSSRLGAIAAMAGSAVGLGNIWLFPAQTGANGGAAFLLIYLLACLLFGLPLMITAIALGRRSGTNPFHTYAELGNKNWRWLGGFHILTGFIILSFYLVIAGQCLAYFFHSLTGDFQEVADFSDYAQTYAGQPGPRSFFTLVFMVLTALVVSPGIKNGIENISKKLMPVLVVLLIALISYVFISRTGTQPGLKAYLYPDFSKIDMRLIASALGMAFFSLSIGSGAMITYGSYLSKKENLMKTASLVVLLDVLIAFMAGLLIFPLAYSLQMGDELSQMGPDLIFVVLPNMFYSMGSIGGLVSGTFFLLLCMAALTSTISLFEVSVAFAEKQFGWKKRSKTASILGVMVLMASIPSVISPSFLDFLSNEVPAVLLPIGCLVMLIFVMVVWKKPALGKELFLHQQESQPSKLGSWIQGIAFFNMFLLALVLILQFL